MDVVCLSCIIIILTIGYIFIRKEKGNYAMAIIPLVFVPVAHLGSNWVYVLISNFININYHSVLFFLDMAALTISCICFGFSSAAIETKSAKIVYWIMCGGFAVLFTFALLKDMIAF